MILLTGATGFLGEFVLKELYKRGLKFKCFVRKDSNIETILQYNIPYCVGELDDVDSICAALEGVDGLINIASLGFGHGPNIVNACENMNVKRAVFISTTGIFTKLNPNSKTVRLEAEDIIKKSTLDYTIIRPTMIFGTPRDRNSWRLVKYIKNMPLIPVLGSGKYLQQPVYVRDLAWAVVSAYESNLTKRKAYNISGKNALTYNEVVDLTADALGKRIFRLHIPMNMSYAILTIYEKISKKPKLKAEQVLRLNENKDFSHKDAEEDFGYKPHTFEEAISIVTKKYC